MIHMIQELFGQTLTAMSSTLRATTSQPRSLLSMARLDMARSRVRPSIISRVLIDHTCLVVVGASPRSACPCSRACGLDFSTGRLRCLTWSYSSVTEDDHHARPVVCFPVFPVADFEGGGRPIPHLWRGAAGQARTPKMMCTMRLTSLKRFGL